MHFFAVFRRSRADVQAGKGLCAFMMSSSLASVAVAQPATPRQSNYIAEGFPVHIAERLAARAAEAATVTGSLSPPAAAYLVHKRRWQPGDIVVVAFNGGTAAHHAAISGLANEWAKYANIRFDFGIDQRTGAYRSWSAQDREYASHVRIGFDEPGAWSAVGSDAIDKSIFPPHEASMNFGGLAALPPSLWQPSARASIIHEFGHALGFVHEHQQQNCMDEIRWQRGPNGEANVYDVLALVYGWNTRDVDTNLRAAWSGSVDILSAHDPKSIMHYAMPAEVFTRGAASPCFVAERNRVLSKQDQIGAARAYPGRSVPVSSPTLPERASTASFARTELSALAVAGRQSSLLATLEARDAAVRPLLYVHIGDESQREEANAIQLAAKRQNFIAPGVENVKGKAQLPRQTQVRYFRESDRADAERIKVLLESNAGEKQVQLVALFSLGKRVTRNVIEVWLPQP